MELAQPRDDRAEDLLGAEATEFFVPVPSLTVRRGIQRSREQEMHRPRHEQDRANAPVRLLDELWQEVQWAAEAHRLLGPRPGGITQPQIYAALYGRLLHARHHTVLRIDELFPVEVSAQEMGTVAGELIPSQEKARQLLSEVDSCEPEELERAVLNWFRI